MRKYVKRNASIKEKEKCGSKENGRQTVKEKQSKHEEKKEKEKEKEASWGKGKTARK